MFEECMICNAPLKYSDIETEMTCMLCGKKEGSNSCCENGHYVCNECHVAGLDQFYAVCLNETSKNPFEIFTKLTRLPFCHMHGPEHHILVGASLATAYRNAGGDINLASVLSEINARGKKVPGGICGFWGTCGAAVSAGQYMSVITKATPLTTDSWALCNLVTSQVLNSIGEVGGPRCCKRNGWLSIIEATKFTAENLDVQMELPESWKCDRQGDNKQCIGNRCPFFQGRALNV